MSDCFAPDARTDTTRGCLMWTHAALRREGLAVPHGLLPEEMPLYVGRQYRDVVGQVTVTVLNVAARLHSGWPVIVTQQTLAPGRWQSFEIYEFFALQKDGTPRFVLAPLA